MDNVGRSGGEGAGVLGSCPAQKLQDLQVVVGRGKRSIGSPQLRTTAVATFKAMGLVAQQVGQNSKEDNENDMKELSHHTN